MKNLFNRFHDRLFQKLNRSLTANDFIYIFVIIGLYSIPNPFAHIGAWFLGLSILGDW